MYKLTNTDLGFDVLCPSCKKWEEFEKELKESSRLFFSKEPKETCTTLPKENNQDKEKEPEDATTTMLIQSMNQIKLIFPCTNLFLTTFELSYFDFFFI